MALDVAHDGSAYQAGPVTVEAECWPPEWTSFADETLHRSDEPRVQLRVRFTARGHVHAARNTLPQHIRAHVELDGDALHLEVPDAVEGNYRAEDATLRLVAAADASPRMTLGNGLRLFLSGWLPYRLDGLMFHAAAGILDGCGVLFPGVSTAGKSTMATRFCRTTYLSDDIALVDGLAAKPRLVGAPFFGINGWRGSSERAPLAAVGILDQKSTAGTLLERLAPARAATALLRHVVAFTRDPLLLEAMLARAADLATSVPVFSVKRDLEDDADTVVERLLEAASK